MLSTAIESSPPAALYACGICRQGRAGLKPWRGIPCPVMGACDWGFGAWARGQQRVNLEGGCGGPVTGAWGPQQPKQPEQPLAGAPVVLQKCASSA